VLCLSDLLPAIIYSLEKMQQWENRDAQTTAWQLLKAITDFEFLVALKLLTHISSHLLILSKSLQAVGKDLGEALREIDTVIRLLQEERNDANQSFDGLYQSIIDQAKTLEIEECKPRTPIRSRFRPNSGCDGTCEEYYRMNVFIPMLDHVIQDLNFRFGQQQRIALTLSKLLPSLIANTSFIDLKPAIKKYDCFLDDNATVEAEFIHWKCQ
jgi:hypothetical protein